MGRRVVRPVIAVLATLGAGVLVGGIIAAVNGRDRALIAVGAGAFMLVAGWWVAIVADRQDAQHKQRSDVGAA